MDLANPTQILFLSLVVGKGYPTLPNSIINLKTSPTVILPYLTCEYRGLTFSLSLFFDLFFLQVNSPSYRPYLQAKTTRPPPTQLGGSNQARCYFQCRCYRCSCCCCRCYHCQCCIVHCCFHCCASRRCCKFHCRNRIALSPALKIDQPERRPQGERSSETSRPNCAAQLG